MVEYSKVNVKLSDSQLNKLKSASKNQTGVTLQINTKKFDWGKIASLIVINGKAKSRIKNRI